LLQGEEIHPSAPSSSSSSPRQATSSLSLSDYSFHLLSDLFKYSLIDRLLSITILNRCTSISVLIARSTSHIVRSYDFESRPCVRLDQIRFFSITVVDHVTILLNMHILLLLLLSLFFLFEFDLLRLKLMCAMVFVLIQKT
jgi:hypothetical protein